MHRSTLLLVALLPAATALAAPEPLVSVTVAELERQAATGLPAKQPLPAVEADIRFERTATIAADGSVSYGCRAAPRHDFRAPGGRPGGEVQR